MVFLLKKRFYISFFSIFITFCFFSKVLPCLSCSDKSSSSFFKEISSDSSSRSDINSKFDKSSFLPKGGFGEYKNERKDKKEISNFSNNYKFYSPNSQESIEDRTTKLKKKIQKSGLNNLGSSCYFNSLLQVLFGCKPLRDKLKKASEKDLNLGAQQLKRLFEKMEEKDLESLNPKSFFKTVVKECFYGDFGQQDASECFNSIINSFLENFSSDFFFFIESIIKCKKCSKEAMKYEPSSMLTLQIPENIKSKKKKLTDCFEKSFYGIAELLKGKNKYYCSACKKNKIATRIMRLKGCPKLLVVSLGRFKYDGGRKKIDKPISFVFKGLNLSQYLSVIKKDEFIKSIKQVKDREEFSFLKKNNLWNNENLNESWTSIGVSDENKKYDLFGVIFHSGSAQFGHYTSLVKDSESGKWYYCNDNYVKEKKESWVKKLAKKGYAYSSNRAPYLLFYKMRDINSDESSEVDEENDNTSETSSFSSEYKQEKNFDFGGEQVVDFQGLGFNEEEVFSFNDIDLSNLTIEEEN